MVEMTGLDKASLVSFLLQVLLKIQRAKIAATKIHSKKLTIITRNRVVTKQSRCEENTIVGNYFFIFYDMPHFVRRDIFAFAKVIL